MPLAFTTPGFAEIVFLVLLALLVFGPEKLPGMARTAGRTLNRLKAEANSTLDELKGSVDVQELRQTANVDELRGVADELRSTSADLERSAALTGQSGAGEAGSGARAGEEARPAGEAPSAEAREVPFDPDAP